MRHGSAQSFGRSVDEKALPTWEGLRLKTHFEEMCSSIFPAVRPQRGNSALRVLGMGFHVYTLSGSGQQPELGYREFRLTQFVLLPSSLKSRYCHLCKIAWSVGAALCNGLAANYWQLLSGVLWPMKFPAN